MKDEPQSRVEHDSVKETKPDSSVSTLEVKSEQKESERKEESTASVKQEERTPEPDSEDSITAERVAEDSQTPENPESTLMRHPMQKRKQTRHKQLPEKERLLLKALENEAKIFKINSEAGGP